MGAWFWLWALQVVITVPTLVWGIWGMLTVERLERERDALWDECYGVEREEAQ